MPHSPLFMQLPLSAPAPTSAGSKPGGAAPRYAAQGGSMALTPITPTKKDTAPEPGPIDKEIRRINSAHQPAVREVASDNEIGRDIVDEDARRLAAQHRSVRRRERTRHAKSGEKVTP